YLTGRGVPAERLSSKGLGETVPLVANDGPEGKAVNRRVEFRVTEDATTTD
ncbi:MAG: OmpA family, partial [Pseudomonadota bacterium]